MIAWFLSVGRLLAGWAVAVGIDLFGRLVAVRDGWNAFWFRPADPLPLGVMRVGTGLVFLWVLLVTGPLLPALYGPEAWVDQQTANLLREETPLMLPVPDWDETVTNPLQRPIHHPERLQGPHVHGYFLRWLDNPAFAYSNGQAQFSPYFHLRSPAAMWAFHLASIAVAGLFTLGLWSRVTCVLAWVVALCYIHRVSSALFGMDTMMAILLLYLAIGPSGDALSLDRWLGDRRRARLGLPVEPPAASVTANLALRLAQVHFCLIYLASGTSKLQGAAWWNGTAVWQTLSNYEFTPERFPGYTAFLHALTQSRLVWELFHSGGSLFTLLLEIGLPFLVWYRGWRGAMLGGALVLHVGISLTMGLHSFSALMLMMAASFVPPEWWRGWKTK